MRISISGLFIYPKLVGGAENYVYNLLKGLSALGKENEFEIVLQEKFRKEFDPIVFHFKPRYISLKSNRILYEYFLWSNKGLGKYNTHLFFPNYTAPLVNTKGLKIFTTIHDLQYIYFPHYFSSVKKTSLRFNHMNSLRKCSKVIAISQNVKNSILDNYGSKWKDRITVIHNPVDFERFSESSSENLGLEGSSYILSVANHFPHKNLLTLVRAYLKLYPKTPRPRKLVLAGQTGDFLKGGKYEKYFRELNDSIKGNVDIIVTGFIDNKNLAWLYENADLFVFPSKFEGFGFPVVEAMGFGLPTITTGSSSIPEVSFGKAYYVEEEENPESWVIMMKKVLSNLEEERATFEEQRDFFRSAFDPRNIAKKYYDLFAQTN
jgi:glycosyltransferase involved in cell wall biosynthesis